ncbi:MAG: hypothetical protein CL608_26320 [Anaerolineaceae bacterium]|nr:hypothetical protein [Anaerolineaceae bacterium]
MNPLEDRLQEYLSQFDDEPEMAPSLRRSAYLEQLLRQAGIVPTNPIELPANTTPELLNTLLTQGDEPMTNQSAPTLTRVRIYSHITQSRFLHMEDALGIGAGKVRFFAGTYRRNQGMNAHCHHFLDLADARVIFGALARGEQGFSYKEYKGTPPQNGNGAVSRVLSIAVKGDNVYIELKTGPGKLTNTGAIAPNGKPEVEVNVGFKLYEARRMAASVLAYLHAWDVLRMMVHQQSVGQPAPYTSAPLSTSLLVATTSEHNGPPTGTVKPENSPVQDNGIHPQQADVANGRPVTRKGSGQANGKATSPTNGSTAVKQPLQYGNGTLVDGKNLTEVQTYRQYLAEKQSAPTSKTALLDFYRQRTQAVADLTKGIMPKRAFADQ